MSLGEEMFYQQCKEAGLPLPIMEYMFMRGKKWSFDFAWPDKKIAIEVEGGVFSGGRHVRPKGFLEDLSKYNQATALGWRVFRFDTGSVKNEQAIKFIKGVLG